jgi:HAD superfamily hydrolase (TIGR01549 family)
MSDTRRFSRVRGVIFDLDGTLVESHLDFNAMRVEMELPDDAPVLETILTLDEARAAHCWQVLERHERRGAERATLIPGVRPFLAALAERGLPQGIVTRNSRRFARETLDKLSLQFDPVMTRDDAPIKPRPEAIWEICKKWGLEPHETVIIGDFRFDLEAGRAAGTRTVLYTRQGALANRSWAAQADFLLHSFEDAAGFWSWLDEPI